MGKSSEHTLFQPASVESGSNVPSCIASRFLFPAMVDVWKDDSCEMLASARKSARQAALRPRVRGRNRSVDESVVTVSGAVLRGRLLTRSHQDGAECILLSELQASLSVQRRSLARLAPLGNQRELCDAAPASPADGMGAR